MRPALDERGSHRFRFHSGELIDERTEPVESTQVSEKLGSQLLLFEDGLRDPRPPRLLPKPTPQLLADALQIVGGDLPGCCHRESDSQIRHFDHFGAPKRTFRLSRPVFRSCDTMVFTTMSGWPSARYCTRHSIELPDPFGLTSIVPT